jgi:hypothetical protein
MEVKGGEAGNDRCGAVGDVRQYQWLARRKGYVR